MAEEAVAIENSGDAGFASPDAADAAAASADNAFDGANDANAETADGAGSEQEGKSGVPEEYEVSLPEGIEISEEREASFVKWAKSNSFSNDQAQSAIDLYLDMAQQDQERVMSDWQSRSSQWVQESKSAGLMDGKVLAQAKAGLQAVDKSGDLGATLHHLGLDHHPGIIEAFRSHGAAVGSPSAVPTGSADGPARAQSMAERMYPTMFKEE